LNESFSGKLPDKKRVRVEQKIQVSEFEERKKKNKLQIKF